jgi:hypothetical protein
LLQQLATTTHLKLKGRKRKKTKSFKLFKINIKKSKFKKNKNVFELSKKGHKVAKTFSKSCQKVLKKNCQNCCPTVVKILLHMEGSGLLEKKTKISLLQEKS